MNTKYVLIGLGVLFLLSRRQPAPRAPSVPFDYLNSGTEWNADMWARFYGADLPQHNCQCSHTAYGFRDGMGFNP